MTSRLLALPSNASHPASSPYLFRAFHSAHCRHCPYCQLTRVPVSERASPTSSGRDFSIRLHDLCALIRSWYGLIHPSSAASCTMMCTWSLPLADSPWRTASHVTP